MCGIAGIVMRDGSAADEAVLDRLAAAMAHRGPDGVGKFLAGPVGLLSTRLAIIDLATGDQPLFDEAGAVLVANGEIYNDPEIRAGLTCGGWTTGRTASRCSSSTAATGPISWAACAGCTRSRCSIPPAGAWCWRATRSG